MKLRIVLALVIGFVLGAMLLFRGNTLAATTPSVAERLKALEDKVVALEQSQTQLKNLEALTVEFADELALLNVKVVGLEDKVYGR